MRKLSFILLLTALLTTSCGQEEPKMPWEDDLGKEEQPSTPPAEGEDKEEEPYGVGSSLALWSEGCLDIHTISTGRGECIFIIMPDGTSLVVDAGEFSRESSDYKNVLQRPNSSTRPTKVYADYIRHFLPKSNMIDYFNLSHFHMDHMGNLEKEYIKASAGDYILSGVTALYNHIRFSEVIDRAHPNYYDSPVVESKSDAALANYIKFLDYHEKNSGLKASKFQLGATNQFAMRYNAAAYSNFEIKNICSNGCIWEDGKSVNIYQGKTLNENLASSGFVIRYGKFDFLTAGDIGDYNDFEYRVAKVAGDVDAAKAHHHLSPHSMCKKAMQVLKPEVMPVTSFYVREEQPDKSKFSYLKDGGCNIFCTSVGESLLSNTSFKSDYAKCSATSGHIVIRVAPNGDEYSVYTLDDKDNKYRITKIDGPFTSK